MSEDILQSREQRYHHILNKTKTYETLICVKANTPGLNKNRYSSYFLLRQFDQVIQSSFQVIYHEFYTSQDGPYHLYALSDQSIQKLKMVLIGIEDNHPLGRLVDIDLYHKGTNISRNDININPRTCLLCNNPAIACMRNHTHTLDELLFKIDQMIFDYIEKNIYKLINNAMLKELNLEDKFGLVTPSSTGSHQDMNYEMMLQSKDIIIKYLLEILKTGFIYPHDDQLYHRARAIGIKAELEMYEKTNQVNTYKGLIYLLGFVCLSISHVIRNHLNFEDIFTHIKTLSQDVFDDFNKDVQSSGIHAYLNYQITGIRGEVFNGLPTILKAMRAFSHIDVDNDMHQHQILLYFMIHSEDTVLLKRAGSLKNYQHFKQMAAQVNPYVKSDVKSFTKYCINHHISIGGSADLFIVFHFLNQVKKTFNL